MAAKVNGKATWIIDEPSNELEKKYKGILTELAQTVGACVNSGDIEAYQFLLNHAALIFQGDFEVLKETVEGVKSKTFNDFLKKVGLNN